MWKVLGWLLLASMIVAVLPYLLLAAALIFIVRVLVAAYSERQERRAGLIARAEQQHAWVIAGDPRGTFGSPLSAYYMQPVGVQHREQRVQPVGVR